MSRRTAPAAQTCGELGGIGLAGTPCRKAAGFGTDHPGTGRCKSHDETAIASLQANKSKFLERYSSGTVALNKAAAEVGVDPATIWRWRQTDPAFDAQVADGVKRSDNVRVALVEDSMFNKILAGKAAPAETIFFLVNRGGGRWRHIQTIQHQGDGGGALVVRVIREAANVSTDG